MQDGSTVPLSDSLRKSIQEINTQWGAGEVRGPTKAYSVPPRTGSRGRERAALTLVGASVLGASCPQQPLRVLAMAVVDKAKDKKDYKFDNPTQFATYEVCRFRGAPGVAAPKGAEGRLTLSR